MLKWVYGGYYGTVYHRTFKIFHYSVYCLLHAGMFSGVPLSGGGAAKGRVYPPEHLDVSGSFFVLSGDLL